MKKVTTLFSAALITFLGFMSVQAQDITSISDARDLAADTEVTIEGIITSPDYGFGNNQFFMQDSTAGISVIIFGSDAEGTNGDGNSPFAEGDSITITGTTGAFNGLVQIESAAGQYTILSSDNPLPAPVEITPADITTDSEYQSMRVSVSPVSLAEGQEWPEDAQTSSGVDVEVVSGDSTFILRIDRDESFYDGAAAPNETFGLTGNLGSYNAGQILPFYEGDIANFYDVTFQADMNDIIDSAAFIPGEDFITIPGSMNDWSTTADTLTDGDEDGVYTKTLSIAEGDYAYKFHIYSNTGRISGGYEANQPTDNTNRNITISSDSTLEAMMPSFDYQDLNDAIFGEVELYFQVDMSIQELNGNFDPDNDEYVSISGSFDQDWNTSAYPMTETQTDGVYEGTITFSTEKPVPSTFQYKFTIVNADESVTYESGDNKMITVTEDGLFEGTYLAQNAASGDIPYFDNIGPEDVFTEDTDVLFEVDLRPAYYHLADSSVMPADVQTGTGADSSITWLYGNGPLLANGWEDWGVTDADAQAAGLYFNDNGEDGDEVAGDSLFSATFSFGAGDARTGAFKLGVNGQDNEAGFGADHTVTLEGGGKIEIVFGAFVRADTVYDDLYDEYILATEEGPVVVRRGGSGDDGVIVSNEEETIESPQEFTLSQNYPNPFNPTTNINFTLPQATNVSLTVYNILGQQVARLVNGRLAAGQHSVQFDASNLASGMYLYRIEAGTFSQNKKMMLIK